jgi:hypothetical protein
MSWDTFFGAQVQKRKQERSSLHEQAKSRWSLTLLSLDQSAPAHNEDR